MDRRIFLGSMASTLKEILPRLSHAALLLPVDDTADLTDLTPVIYAYRSFPFGGLKISGKRLPASSERTHRLAFRPSTASENQLLMADSYRSAVIYPP
jgi:hypothetical protein